MGSTTIPVFQRMLPQGQEKAAANVDTKKETLGDAFADCMQQMSSKLNQMITSVPAETGVSVGARDKMLAEQNTVEYENYPCRRTEVKVYDETQERPNPEEATEVVDTYGQDVKEAVRDSLDVTEDELEAAMVNLGLTVLDLTDPANLAALTAELIGADDVGDVLFLTNFQQLMQDVGGLTADLAQKLHLPVEQLSELVPTEQSAEELKDQPIILPADMQVSQEQESIEVPVMNETDKMSGQELQPVEKELPVTDERVTKVQENVAGREGIVQEKQPEISLSEEQQSLGDEAVADMEEALAKTVVSVENEEGSSLDQGDSSTRQKAWFNQTTSQQGQPEAHAAAAANVENKIPVATENAGQPVAYSSQIDTADVIRQIVEFTQVHTAERATTLEMQLNPEHLGKLYLELTSKEGVVTAKIYTQTELVREALEAQMADLKVNMNQAGVKVEAVEISAEPHAFEHNLEQQAKQEERHAEENEKNLKQNRRINLNDMDDMDGLSGLMSEEEALVARIMADNGNSIDFMA